VLLRTTKVIAMHRFLTIVAGGLLLLGSLGLASGVVAATIGPTTTCSNGLPDTPGLGVICEVTVNNTITAAGGSATVTIRECHGAAGDPTAACTTTTNTVSSPVTVVRQCNSALNGGGATVRCSVRVRNHFIGVSAGLTNATVNQCVGSGDGIANNCDPFPATTGNATITQCNGSANGGTLVNLQCTADGRQSSALRVRVNQCNGSANGGGALVICSANIANTVTGGPSPTIPPTDAPTPTRNAATTDPGPMLAFSIFVLAFVVACRRYLRTIRTG
jgi:hypothetical protein